MLTLFLVKGIIQFLSWNPKATHVHRNGLHFIPSNRIIFDGHFSFFGTIQQPIATPPYLRGSITVMGVTLGLYRLFLMATGLTIALVPSASTAAEPIPCALPKATATFTRRIAGSNGRLLRWSFQQRRQECLFVYSRERQHGVAMLESCQRSARLVWRHIGRHKMHLLEIEPLRRRARQLNVAAMHRIKSPTEQSNVHLLCR